MQFPTLLLNRLFDWGSSKSSAISMCSIQAPFAHKIKRARGLISRFCFIFSSPSLPNGRISPREKMILQQCIKTMGMICLCTKSEDTGDRAPNWQTPLRGRLAWLKVCSTLVTFCLHTLVSTALSAIFNARAVSQSVMSTNIISMMFVLKELHLFFFRLISRLLSCSDRPSDQGQPDQPETFWSLCLPGIGHGGGLFFMTWQLPSHKVLVSMVLSLSLTFAVPNKAP